MDTWADTQVYQLLEQLIPALKGECKACNEPCKFVHGNLSSDRVCGCCVSYEEEAH